MKATVQEFSRHEQTDGQSNPLSEELIFRSVCNKLITLFSSASIPLIGTLIVPMIDFLFPIIPVPDVTL